MERNRQHNAKPSYLLLLLLLLLLFEPKKDEITGGYRKLHEEELPNLFSSPNIIRMIN
jgi:hypothetical protein